MLGIFACSSLKRVGNVKVFVFVAFVFGLIDLLLGLCLCLCLWVCDF